MQDLGSIQLGMSTKDHLLGAELHGTAMRYAAEKRDLAESIAELREMANGRDAILARLPDARSGGGTRHRPPMVV